MTRVGRGGRPRPFIHPQPGRRARFFLVFRRLRLLSRPPRRPPRPPPRLLVQDFFLPSAGPLGKCLFLGMRATTRTRRITVLLPAMAGHALTEKPKSPIPVRVEGGRGQEGEGECRHRYRQWIVYGEGVREGRASVTGRRRRTVRPPTPFVPGPANEREGRRRRRRRRSRRRKEHPTLRRWKKRSRRNGKRKGRRKGRKSGEGVSDHRGFRVGIHSMLTIVCSPN